MENVRFMRCAAPTADSGRPLRSRLAVGIHSWARSSLRERVHLLAHPSLETMLHSLLSVCLRRACLATVTRLARQEISLRRPVLRLIYSYAFTTSNAQQLVE